MKLGALELAGLMLCIGLACCAGPQRQKAAEVEFQAAEAEGWAPYEARDPEGSRRRALADAQRKAAEKVNGVTISATSLVAEAVGVRSRILSESAGGVLDWEVLGQKIEAGFLKIRIRARVLVRPAGLPAQIPPLGVQVSVSANSEAAASALRRELLAGGFSVVVSSSPDIALWAEVKARPVEYVRLGDFRSSRAALTARAVRVKTGEVIWETARESAELDFDVEVASRRAMEAVGRAAGKDAAKALARLCWQRY
jgi:hypothetical protein